MFKEKKYFIFFFLLLIVGFFIFSFHSCNAGPYDYEQLEPIPGSSATTGANLKTYIESIYKFAIWTVGIAAILMITIGGFMYLTSAGNTSKMDNAKRVVVDATIGLIVVLTAYLVLYVINPDLVKITISLKSLSSGMSGAIINSGTTTSVGKLATGCNNYSSAFSSASGGDKNLECLLIAIANQESGCNPNVASPAGACGMMQILPKTAGINCDELKNSPEKSIQIARQYIDKARGNIQSYSGFDIGSNYNLSEKTIFYGSYAYNTGNDDLIASYNAGSGKIAATVGKKGPFVVSSDCPSPVTPAWQCHINPGGYSETQNYVVRVQKFQRQCLSK